MIPGLPLLAPPLTVTAAYGKHTAPLLLGAMPTGLERGAV